MQELKRLGQSRFHLLNDIRLGKLSFKVTCRRQTLEVGQNLRRKLLLDCSQTVRKLRTDNGNKLWA
jgi:hypothetical protein